MRTITFYSYKGGVGRSLLVANAARYLSFLGKSVVALDLDLEAPGLHYKFELGVEGSRIRPSKGIVDILSGFLEVGQLPKDLMEYAVEVPVSPNAGRILIMRAGAAPEGDYWRKLSKIDWYDLFYGPEPTGTQFFLELQERVRQDLNPDFFLIDARTGVTDMGGVATTLLPDTVVCLALDSIEHLEGIRAMMLGVKQTTSKQGTQVNLVPVISRLLVRKDDTMEVQQLKKVQSFLNEPLKEGGPVLGLAEVIALHSEPLLDTEEQLLVGGSNSPHDLPLLRDYLKLFSKIIPAEEVRPHVGLLIQQAISRLLDDPDGAQSDLEALTTYCADEDAYRALLKLYQVRKAPLEKSIATAALMWQLHSSGSVPEPLLADIVRSAYSEPRASELQKKYADFAANVWRSNGIEDVKVLINIANAYLPERRDRAVRLLVESIERAREPQMTAIVRLVDVLRGGRFFSQALTVVNKFKILDTSPEFQTAWAKLLVDQNNEVGARAVLQDPAFNLEAVRLDDPVALIRLLKLANGEIAIALLRDGLEVALARHDFSQLQEIATMYHEQDNFDEFVMRSRGRVPDDFIDDMTKDPRRRNRRYRGY
ncbi:KGGVGR-motif variant AAA ATPase [Terriglobus sp. TAA 43]|uniref:KGGVGR-motif variant AAA ATPase n=1 Tax=Terriglobus sp. TAA 43 TaxID=278961 RepID=UPI0006467132|nr:hypothetical protein [Terriglobus sp. TAA 43]